MIPFPVGLGQRQDGVVVEVDEAVLEPRLRKYRQGQRRGRPIIRIIVVAITAVGDATLEFVILIRPSYHGGNQVQENGKERETERATKGLHA